MKLIFEGEPKEIAALVLEIQGRQEDEFIPETADGPCVGGVSVESTASS